MFSAGRDGRGANPSRPRVAARKRDPSLCKRDVSAPNRYARHDLRVRRNRDSRYDACHTRGDENRYGHHDHDPYHDPAPASP